MPSVCLKGICLLHNNSPASKSRVVEDFVSRQKVNVLTHPPYSPDLSPCDVFLSPRHKKDISGRKYNNFDAQCISCLTQISRANYGLLSTGF